MATIVVAALVAVLVGVLAFAAGRNSDDAAAHATPPPPKTFSSPQQLIAEMEKRGLPCPGYSPVDKPIDAVAMADCTANGKDVLVTIYATHADALAAFQRVSGIMHGLSSTDMAVGENWTVNCDDASFAKQVAQALGGEYMTSS